MSEKLEALDRMFHNLDHREEYSTSDAVLEDYVIIKSAIERKEKLEKVWEIIIKEIEDSFISGIYPNEEGIAFDFKILKKDKPEQFNLLKEMLK